MSVLCCSFGYPGYPEQEMMGRVRESQVFLERIGVPYESTAPVIEHRDCDQAVQKATNSEWDGLIVVVATWVEAPNVVAVTTVFRDRPVLLWVHENLPPDEQGVVMSLGSVAAGGVLRQTFEELGYSFRFVVGNPFDEKITGTIRAFAWAVSAIARLKKDRLGLVGYGSMGMYTALADPMKVKRVFGAEIVHIDQYSVLGALGAVNPVMVGKTMEQMQHDWCFSPDVDPVLLEKSARVLVRLKDLVHEQRIDAITVKCQYEMSLEYGFAPCLPLSILGGEMPVSCEGDLLLLLTQTILQRLSRQITTYGDILAFLPDGVVSAACGFAPRCFLQDARPVIEQHTALYQGLLVTSRFKQGMVTMARLANFGDGFKMHCILGYMEELKNFREIGCPPYAGTGIRFAHKSVDDFQQEIMSQHYALVEGDWTGPLEVLCRLLGITVV